MSAARGVVVSVVTGLVVSLVPAVPVLAAVAVPGTAGGATSGDVSVPVTPRGGVAPQVPVPVPDAVSVVWPVAGSAVVSLASPSGYLAGEGGAVSGSRSPGGLPVTVRPPSPAPSGALGGSGVSAAPTSVRLSVWSQAAAEAAGVRGVVLEVSRADGVDAAAQVGVEVSYAAFAHGYGGDFGSRLRLATLPSCVLSMPQVASCQVLTPVPSANSTVARSVSAAVVDIPGGAGASGAGLSGSAADDGGSGSSVVLAVTAGASSDAGDFAATSLAPSYAWAAGGQSGDFGTSVAVRVPPAPGGLQPSVSLGYSSGSVDGRVGSTNNQPSWLGEGWDAQFGYVEAHYRSCRDDGQSIDDWCYDDNTEYSLVFGGRSSRLVLDDTQGWFHTEQDDGLRVEQRWSASNGVDRGIHWVAYTQDGTAYWFGTDAQSTLSVPVFGDDPGERCHLSQGLAYSYCNQGWRWNIRKVVDRRGNTMEYFWTKENHNYGRYPDATGHLYDRGAVLARIDYGANTTAGTPHTARVEFVVGWRCLAEPCMGGTSNTWKWYDTPWDLYCSLTLTSCPHVTAPVFFSLFRLKELRTLVGDGAGGWSLVDVWEMGHSWPATGDGTSMALWLYTIAHVGHYAEAGADPDLQGEVTWFGSTALANRVYVPGYNVPMNKHRINHIATNYGGDTWVAYAPTECTPSTLPAESNNTKRCFPVHWTNGPGGAEWNWFHKYVVASVTEKGTATADADETWTYTYGNSSTLTNSQVMWAWDDGPNVPNEDKSWTQWRGYLNVEVNHGPTSGANRSSVRTLYHRGLHGDRTTKNGGPPLRSVTMSDGGGGTVVDERWLRGFARSETTMDWAVGDRVAWVQHVPVAALSAYRLYDFGKATIVREGSTITNSLRRDGTVRTRQVDHSYDITGSNEDARYGLPLSSHDLGDTSVAGDETCTRTSYTQNVGTWMLAYPSTVTTTTEASCGGLPSLDATYLAGSQVFYDGATTATGPLTRGLGTTTRQLAAFHPSGLVWAATGTASYDTHGRVTEAFDALGRRTATAFTPTAGGPTTRTTVTNPAGHVATVDLNPAWGSAKKVTDPNGKVTTVSYDGLGRTSAVDLPGPSAVPNLQYDYQLRTSGGSVVTTRTLGPDNTALTSHAIYDGRLRPRQAQTLAPDGNRAIADIIYDNRGLTAKTAVFYNASPPSSTLVSAADSAIANQHVYLYDSLGRPTADILMSHAVEKWRTTASHWGDQTFADQPVGGTDTTTLADVFGRTTTLRQHTSSGDLDTGYAYTRLGQLSSVTDPAGNQWTYGYDLRGRTTQTADPDRGATTLTYDVAGQLLTTRDARSVTLAYRYDTLGRTTGLFRDSVATGTKLADWVYDTLAKGQLTSATRYHGGNPYTTAVTGYDDGYRPTGSTVSIPAAEVGLAGSYTFAASYKPDGSPATHTLPALGGLSAETLTYGYTPTGRIDTMTGAAPYVTDTGWHFDDLLNWTWHGSAGKQVLQQFNIDGIRRLSAIEVRTENQPVPGTYDSRAVSAYDYDQAGNIIAITGYTDGVQDHAECFTYDSLRRLTRAFTATANTNCGTPQRAGADPYHLEWEYDNATGNRTKQTEHGPSASTVTTYTYPAPGAAQPHTLRQATRTGAATGTDTYSYDPAGNTLTRPGQTLTWDPEGHLATLVAGGQTSTYIYDPDGNRLITRDGTGKTLYLSGGMELRHDTGTGQTTGTRYYSHAGHVVAVRTTGSLSWLAADHHGTPTHAINPTTLTVQQRRHLPFGGTRGTPPANWPGDKGFVGGTQGPTGLTHLGAREYDPQTGRFISVDPIQRLNNPQQWNGYTYANNNPTTLSDPDGLEPGSWCANSACAVVTAQSQTSHPMEAGFTNGVARKKKGPKIDPKEYAKAYIKHTGKRSGNRPNYYLAHTKAEQFTYMLAQAIYTAAHAADGPGYIPSFGCYLCPIPEGGTPQTGREQLHDALALAGLIPVVGEVADGADAVLYATEGDYVNMGLSLVGLVPMLGVLGGIRRLTRAAKACNSFAPGTLVLMADGSAKPIEDVVVGDQVLATDPATGRTEPRQVAATIRGDGAKELIDILIDIDGLAGDALGVVTATKGHPFWVENRRTWQDAGNLDPHDRLRTPTGQHVEITETIERASNATVYNLTVSDIHTYYVLVGSIPVLVHNCGNSLDDVLATQHGQERLAERGFDALDIALTRGSANAYEQLDGAIAHVAQAGENSYNVIVVGGEGIVTAMKGLQLSEVDNLARNYGWTGYP